MESAGVLLVVIAGYALIGVLFALAFVTRGVATLDHAAKGAPWTFRVLIFPACAALWPVIAGKWFRARGRE